MAELLTDPNAPDPVLPGAWFIFDATHQQTVESNPGSTVFVHFTDDWGPDGQTADLQSFQDYLDTFGDSDTPGRRAVLDAFLGEGIPGRGGAGAVIAYRLCSSSGAKATKNIANTAGSPTANALALTALYKGSRGNSYNFTTQALDGSNDQLVLLRGGSVVDTITYPNTDIANLAAQINASKLWPWVAVANATGTRLATISGVAASGGNDGTAYSGNDYSAMLNALEFEPFTVFAAYDLTDSTITAALVAWKASVKARGKLFFLGLGGAAAESFAAHKARAGGLADPSILAFGTGNIIASEYFTDGSTATISTAQGIARVMGAVARRGGLFDMVNVRFAGWTIAPGTGATRDQAKTAATSGMTLLTRDGDTAAPTKIGLGVTSWAGDTATRPFAIYSVVKFVRTLELLEAALTADQEGGGDELIDGRSVDSKSRDLIRGRSKAVLKSQFIEAGMLLPSSGVDFDPRNPPRVTDSSVALVYDAYFVPGLRGIRNRIRVNA